MTDPFALPIGGSLVETGPCAACLGTGRAFDPPTDPCVCCGGTGEAADRWTRVSEHEWLVEPVDMQATLFAPDPDEGEEEAA